MAFNLEDALKIYDTSTASSKKKVLRDNEQFEKVYNDLVSRMPELKGDENFRQLAYDIAMKESGGRYDAKGPRLPTGKHKGDRAVGMWQLMPNTAKTLGVNPNDIDEMNRGGLQYLANNYLQFDKDPKLAAIAHHGGPGAVERFIATGSSGVTDQATGLSTDDYAADIPGKQESEQLYPTATVEDIPISEDKSAEIPVRKDKDTGFDWRAFNVGRDKGYLLNYAPELKGLAGGYSTSDLRNEQRRLEAESPVSSMLGEITGSFLQPLNYVGAGAAAKAGQMLAGPGRKLLEWGSKYLPQATIGAAQGYGEKRDIKDAVVGATIGGVIGTTGAYAGKKAIEKGTKLTQDAVVDKLNKIIKNKDLGWKEEVGRMFNLSADEIESISDEDIIKHATKYVDGLKTGKIKLSDIDKPSVITPKMQEAIDATAAKEAEEAVAAKAAADAVDPEQLLLKEWEQALKSGKPMSEINSQYAARLVDVKAAKAGASEADAGLIAEWKDAINAAAGDGTKMRDINTQYENRLKEARAVQQPPEVPTQTAPSVDQEALQNAATNAPRLSDGGTPTAASILGELGTDPSKAFWGAVKLDAMNAGRYAAPALGAAHMLESVIPPQYQGIVKIAAPVAAQAISSLTGQGLKTKSALVDQVLMNKAMGNKSMMPGVSIPRGMEGAVRQPTVDFAVGDDSPVPPVSEPGFKVDLDVLYPDNRPRLRRIADDFQERWQGLSR